jgi:threonine/homoserine/homoserine lactone efflux protein
MLSFLLYTIAYSLTGVMAPGAITAATIAQGGRNRWAGAWIAVGHGILEIPLIFVLLFGVGTILQTATARILIGIGGGLFLLWLAVQMFRDIRRPAFDLKDASRTAGPLATGLVLSATNPYFLFWWATGGLLLAQQAQGFGMAAVVLFAAVHWGLDLIWLTILSMGAFHGANLLGRRNQKLLMGLCAAALAYFGVVFLMRAVKLLADNTF